ncbi:MAG: hypothetical protein NZ551_09875 [Microscillaceae bacterium]|nr:hypothetical protein [Microscillaceae bacterium]MDW8461504.1 hypothetical protein [Cytophagales bacterium]
MQTVTLKYIIATFISISLLLLLCQFSFAKTENSHTEQKATLSKENASSQTAKNKAGLQKKTIRKAKKYTFRLYDFSTLEKIEIEVEIELENIPPKRTSLSKSIFQKSFQLSQCVQMLILNIHFTPFDLTYLPCKLYLLFQALKIP